MAVWKKIWSIAWRAVLFMLAVSIVVIAVILGNLYKKHARRYCIEKELSCDVILKNYYNRQEMDIYNTRTRTSTVKDVEWISEASENDSLAVYCKRNRRGYFNINTGEEVIPWQYEKAWVFSEGLAAVVRDGKIGFINSRNEEIIPFEYCFTEQDGTTIDYLFRNGLCPMTNSAGDCGLIDKSGKWVLEAKYDRICSLHENRYRVVKDGEKYGLLDENLQFIFPIEYDNIEYASDGKGVFLTKNGYKWQADYDGTVLRPFVCDGTYYLSYMSGFDTKGSEVYVMSPCCVYYVSGLCGVMRKDNGKILIPAIYEQINMLSPTLFEARLEDEEEWIFLDMEGNIVKP